MPSRTLLWPARCAALLVAFGFIAITSAQNPNPPSSPTANTNDQWLAQTAKLYYSSTKAGLQSFDCALHPDWRALYSTNAGGSLAPEDAQRAALLSSVSMALHGRLKGGSSLDWNPPDQQFNTDQTNLLNQMHDALNQTLMGFMQFWTPFVDGSVVPDNSGGLDIGPQPDGGLGIHLVQSDIDLTEVFDSGHILRQYNIVMSGTKIEVTPTYSPSDHGLVITHFHAYIHAADDPQKTQEMNVEVAYQWLEGFPIPARLDMEVTGVATLHFTLDGCTVQRQTP